VIDLTRWPNLNADNPGEPWLLGSWEELYDNLSVATEFGGKWEHPGWSAAEFRDNKRELANVQRVHALVFDYDKGGTIDDALPVLKAIGGGFLHTSKSHALSAHRFRVVIPFARPVSRYEFSGVWRRIAPLVGNVDPAPKDSSRFWYLPGGGEVFEVRRWEGSPIDPDAWLDKPEPAQRRAPEPLRTAPTGGPMDAEERARRYIAKMPASISGAGGHMACWEAALYLARGFALSEERTLAILRDDFNPRCEPAWSERELEHKAKNAFNSERLPLGFLLNDSREWRPKMRRIPPPPPEDGEASDPPEWFVDSYDGEPAETSALHEESERPEGEPKDERSATERYGVVEVRALFFDVLAEVKRGKSHRGFPTGHWEVDSLLGGLRRGHVTLLAAGTSWGKSSWGVMVADVNLRAKVPVLVVSVEDANVMYGKRLVARRAGINALNLRDNDCNLDEQKQILRVAGEAENAPFLLSGIGRSVEYLAQAIRELVAEREIGIVICDYVQRFRTTKFASDRRNQVTYVAETLSDAIKMSNASGVLLSQLKRIEGRKPTMDDVKESGDLENMAEHVLLGHRVQDRPYAQQSQDEAAWRRSLACPKNKDGPTTTGEIEMPFNEVTANFVEVEDPNIKRLDTLRAAEEGERELARYGEN
jgi:replicative DNA helicase